MAITASKRKEMMDLILSVFGALDPSGKNVKKYKDLFDGMSLQQFDTFFKKFFANPDEYLILDIVEYENDVKMEYIEKAAKILKVPLYEKVVMPNVNMDSENPVVSKYEVPVGYLHMKPMQQILAKKNSTSTNISSRSSVTGQVVGKDKNARESDQENFALVTLGADAALAEFMGPRSDDMKMKSEMYTSISKNGYVSIKDLTNKVENKTTLNTIDTILIGMGIKSDLITEGLVLPKTLKD